MEQNIGQEQWQLEISMMNYLMKCGVLYMTIQTHHVIYIPSTLKSVNHLDLMGVLYYLLKTK